MNAIIVSTAVFAVLGGLHFSVVVTKPHTIALGNEGRELPEPGPIVIVGPLIAINPNYPRPYASLSEPGISSRGTSGDQPRRYGAINAPR